MTRRIPTSWLAVLGGSLLGTLASADDVPFVAAKRVLEAHCVECHGGALTKGSLDLTTREGLLKGGDLGPAVSADDPESSELYRRVTHAAEPGMPFKRAKLSEADIAALAAWIKAGAAYDSPLSKSTGDQWWSLKPLVKPAPPDVPAEWQAAVRTPIDRFILARLKEKSLSPSPPADRRTLLRRVSFDLIGLPPTFEEIEAFVHDASPTAYEDAVDTLLASPHYGERWARHWMDAVHYAETHGHDQDRPRPNAWPYRDYLVRSFNDDKPYGRFVEEQIAGDILFPDDPQATVALGMLATGPWDESSLMSIRDDTIDRKIAQYLDRDDIVSTALSTFASTTVHCARCHDHKFDPISQVDYYRLQAVFAGVDKAERSYDNDPAVANRRRELAAEKHRLESLRGKTDPVFLSPEVQQQVATWEQGLSAAAKQWLPLAPMSAVSANGATLTVQSDGSVLSGGTRPEKDTYTITAVVDLPTITAIRMEVLTDDSLSHKGPGRQDNGNLHLSEIRVTAATKADPQTQKPVALQNPVADFNQDGWTIAHAIDGNPATAWGVHPAVGQPHRAVFALKEPLDAAGGVTLTIVLEQLHGGGHLIGRPRLSVTSVPKASLDADVLRPDIVALLQVPAEQRTDSHRAALGGYVLERQVESQIGALPPQRMVYAAAFDFKPDGGFRPAGTPREVRVLKRGEITKPEEVATPGGLRCVAGLNPDFAIEDPNIEGLRRAALARWLSDPKNVLTWRSIVNRVWHHHFGRGLCDTPNDLGRMGGVPSHPELIDWLAVTLQESGGSLKSLHRLIVTSAVYRQSSQHNVQAAEIDGENRLLWWMNRSRLDAESLRDAVLATTGKLDRTMGGPSVKQFIESPGIHVTPNVDYAGFDPDRPENFRRSVYRFIFRTLPDPLMDTFDCADASQLTPARNVSVSALQALAMLNNRFLVRQSEHLAARAERAATDLPTRIDAACRFALGRLPSQKERQAFTSYAAKHGLSNACRVLLNSNEFLFVD